MARVVVIGSLNMDLVARAERFPAPGETVPGSSFARFPGGKGANQATAAARMGAETLMVGAVGDDPFGAALVSELRAADVDTAHVRTLPDEPTGTALITLAGAENSIVVVPGANGRVTEADVAGVALHAGDVVLLQLEIPPQTVAAALRAARAAGATSILNAAPALPEATDLVRRPDILVVNESELALFAGRPVDAGSTADLLAAAGGLRAEGRPVLVVTRGRQGALVIGADGATEIAGRSVEAVDSTGAGDCFAGALAAGLASGRALAEAARLANAAAALSVTRPGAGPSMPRLGEVEVFARLPFDRKEFAPPQ